MKNEYSITWGRVTGLDDALAEALARGLTAAETARILSAKFGLSISRMAVIGRARRQGLTLGGDRNTPPKKIVPRKKPKPKPILVVVPQTVERETQPMTEPKPQGDKDCGCRWMHGEAQDRNFCCAPTWQFSSWCEYHYRRAFDVVSTRASSRRARALKLAAV